MSDTARTLPVPARGLSGRDPPDRAWRHRQRLPGGDGARTFPSLSVVGHARKQAAQLDGSGELATTIEGGADGGGICLGDDEHTGSMGASAVTGKYSGAVPRPP
jgi:hypothetical protein